MSPTASALSNRSKYKRLRLYEGAYMRVYSRRHTMPCWQVKKTSNFAHWHELQVRSKCAPSLFEPNKSCALGCQLRRIESIRIRESTFAVVDTADVLRAHVGYLLPAEVEAKHKHPRPFPFLFHRRPKREGQILACTLRLSLLLVHAALPVVILSTGLSSTPLRSS